MLKTLDTIAVVLPIDNDAFRCDNKKKETRYEYTLRQNDYGCVVRRKRHGNRTRSYRRGLLYDDAFVNGRIFEKEKRDASYRRRKGEGRYRPGNSGKAREKAYRGVFRDFSRRHGRCRKNAGKGRNGRHRRIRYGRFELCQVLRIFYQINETASGFDAVFLRRYYCKK